MNLETPYLGLRLAHPFVAGASPLVDDLDTVRRLEDAGAAAITMSSLFEEQITHEQMAGYFDTELHDESSAEARTYFPETSHLGRGPENFLEHLRRVKEAVRVPVIGSLNGSTPGGWLHYARLIQDAGADALELNVYSLASDPAVPGAEVERQTLDMVRTVRRGLTIPVAAKLSPFYSSLAHFAAALVEAGASGLVLFNRFYQPDIDVERLVVERALRLSHPSELALRLRWLAILSPQVRTSYAVTGGVHGTLDAVKALMAGAHAVQMVSALLTHGPEHLRTMRLGLERWLEEHEYVSVAQLRGSMSLATCPDPAAYERANYMLILQSWTAPR
jgi:dihydroorotate dehydrogenase (fumarate)